MASAAPIPPIQAIAGMTVARFRLTVLYSGLFLAAGTGLLATTYLLVDHTTERHPHRPAATTSGSPFPAQTTR